VYLVRSGNPGFRVWKDKNAVRRQTNDAEIVIIENQIPHYESILKTPVAPAAGWHDWVARSNDAVVRPWGLHGCHARVPCPRVPCLHDPAFWVG